MVKGRFSSRALRNRRRAQHPVGNAKATNPRSSRAQTRPLRRDPTRSIMLRLHFLRALRAGYARLRADIIKLVQDDDALGLRRPDAPDVAPVTPIWVVGNAGEFKEEDHPRGPDGKFGSGGGSSGNKPDASPGGKDTGGQANHEAKAKDGEEKAKGLVGRWLGKVSALVDKTPGLGHAKRAVSATMGAIHGKLADRYGDKAATIIMTSGSLGGYPVMFAALATVGFTIPVVTDLVSIAAHTLVAEAMFQLGIIKGGKKPTGNALLDELAALLTNAEDGDDGDLPPPATISQEASRAWVAIAMSFAAAVAEHKDKIEGRLEHEGELLLEAKKHFDKEGRPGEEGEAAKPTANAMPVERVYEALAQEFAGTGDALDHGQCGAVARALELANPAFKPYALTTYDPYGSTSGGRKITHLLVSADGGETFLDGRGRHTKAQVLAGVDQEDGPELVPARYHTRPGTPDGGHYTAEGTREEFQAGPHPRVLALTGNARPVANDRWQYEDNPRKVERFRAWLRERMQTNLAGDALIEEYIARGYKKGQGRGYDDSKKVKAGQGGAAALGVSKDEYLRQQQFLAPTVAKVKLLAGRAYSDLEGVNARMGAVMGRILADGLVQGKTPAQIAAQLADEVGIARTRAEAIAHTEIVRAHAEGQLDALEDMGVGQVEASVEWDTTDNPCPLCRPMNGAVFSIDQARGMLPRHPHCKCAWKPAGADVVAKAASSPQGTRAAQAKAVGRSVRAETGERSNKKAAAASGWAGADLVGNFDPLAAELDIILAKGVDDGHGEA